MTRGRPARARLLLPSRRWAGRPTPGWCELARRRRSRGATAALPRDAPLTMPTAAPPLPPRPHHPPPTHARQASGKYVHGLDLDKPIKDIIRGLEPMMGVGSRKMHAVVRPPARRPASFRVLHTQPVCMRIVPEAGRAGQHHAGGARLARAARRASRPARAPSSHPRRRDRTLSPPRAPRAAQRTTALPHRTHTQRTGQSSIACARFPAQTRCTGRTATGTGRRAPSRRAPSRTARGRRARGPPRSRGARRGPPSRRSRPVVVRRFRAKITGTQSCARHFLPPQHSHAHPVGRGVAHGARLVA